MVCGSELNKKEKKMRKDADHQHEYFFDSWLWMQNDQLFPPAAATAGATFPAVTTCSLKPWNQNKPTFLKSRFIVSQQWGTNTESWCWGVHLLL